MLSGESSCWLQITAGHGPAECALAVAKVVTRIQMEAVQADLAVQVLDRVPGPEKGTLVSAIIRLAGKSLAPFLDTWIGTVQWRCPSPYRPRHKRKNWFVAVDRITALSEERIQVAARDIKWLTTKSSGPGGQHVNKTESAVTALHQPSGLRVRAAEARSQFENKKLAIEKLHAKLAAESQRQQAQHTNRRWQQHHHLQRGNPVRTFCGDAFQPC